MSISKKNAKRKEVSKILNNKKLIFETRTGKIIIDYNRCEPVIRKTPNPSCGFACVKADRWYGRNVLKIESNRPVLINPDTEEIKRLCNECLACEYDCNLYGSDCIKIELPFPGIEEYRRKLKEGR
jgi:hypothetical protein